LDDWNRQLVVNVSQVCGTWMMGIDS